MKELLYRLSSTDLRNYFLCFLHIFVTVRYVCVFLYFPADRDECALTHYCMHRCVNTQGSYYCECNAGHKLASNNHSCVGKSLKSHVHSCYRVLLCTTQKYEDNYASVISDGACQTSCVCLNIHLICSVNNKHQLHVFPD